MRVKTVVGAEVSQTEKLIRTLQSQISEVPFLEIKELRVGAWAEERGFDVLAELRIPGGATQMVLGEVKAKGEPRFARAAADQLYRLIHQQYPGAYGILLAPYVSPEAAAICKESHLGYLDLAGNCLLNFGTVYVRREGLPNPAIRKRQLRTLYSPRAERVLRTLLLDARRGWKLADLAAAAEVSLGQVHNVQTLLLDREWVERGRDGLRLREPEKLLGEWAESYDFNRNTKHGFHTLQDLGRVEALVAETGAQEGWSYAFTGFSAAARLAPHARYQRIHVYVGPEALVTLPEVAGLRPVTSGSNVVLLEAYDEGVFHGTEELSGRIVSPAQLYLDLRALGGRGDDAADFLQEKVLRPQW